MILPLIILFKLCLNSVFIASKVNALQHKENINGYKYFGKTHYLSSSSKEDCQKIYSNNATECKSLVTINIEENMFSFNKIVIRFTKRLESNHELVLLSNNKLYNMEFSLPCFKDNKKVKHQSLQFFQGIEIVKKFYPTYYDCYFILEKSSSYWIVNPLFEKITIQLFSANTLLDSMYLPTYRYSFLASEKTLINNNGDILTNFYKLSPPSYFPIRVFVIYGDPKNFTELVFVMKTDTDDGFMFICGEYEISINKIGQNYQNEEIDFKEMFKVYHHSDNIEHICVIAFEETLFSSQQIANQTNWDKFHYGILRVQSTMDTNEKIDKIAQSITDEQFNISSTGDEAFVNNPSLSSFKQMDEIIKIPFVNSILPSLIRKLEGDLDSKHIISHFVPKYCDVDFSNCEMYYSISPIMRGISMVGIKMTIIRNAKKPNHRLLLRSETYSTTINCKDNSSIKLKFMDYERLYDIGSKEKEYYVYCRYPLYSNDAIFKHLNLIKEKIEISSLALDDNKKLINPKAYCLSTNSYNILRTKHTLSFSEALVKIFLIYEQEGLKDLGIIYILGLREIEQQIYKFLIKGRSVRPTEMMCSAKYVHVNMKVIRAYKQLSKFKNETYLNCMFIFPLDANEKYEFLNSFYEFFVNNIIKTNGIIKSALNNGQIPKWLYDALVSIEEYYDRKPKWSSFVSSEYKLVDISQNYVEPSKVFYEDIPGCYNQPDKLNCSLALSISLMSDSGIKWNALKFGFVFRNDYPQKEIALFGKTPNATYRFQCSPDKSKGYKELIEAKTQIVMQKWTADKYVRCNFIVKHSSKIFENHSALYTDYFIRIPNTFNLFGPLPIFHYGYAKQKRCHVNKDFLLVVNRLGVNDPYLFGTIYQFYALWPVYSSYKILIIFQDNLYQLICDQNLNMTGSFYKEDYMWKGIPRIMKYHHSVKNELICAFLVPFHLHENKENHGLLGDPDLDGKIIVYNDRSVRLGSTKIYEVINPLNYGDAYQKPMFLINELENMASSCGLVQIHKSSYDKKPHCLNPSDFKSRCESYFYENSKIVEI